MERIETLTNKKVKRQKKVEGSKSLRIEEKGGYRVTVSQPATPTVGKSPRELGSRGGSHFSTLGLLDFSVQPSALLFSSSRISRLRNFPTFDIYP